MPRGTNAARIRAQLVDCMPRLVEALRRGEIMPRVGELAALVVLCERHRLPAEAARVRRWVRANGWKAPITRNNALSARGRR